MGYKLARCELYCSKRHGPLDISKYEPRLDNKIIGMETLELMDYKEYIKKYLWMDALYFILNKVDREEILSVWNNRQRVKKENFKQFYNLLKKHIYDPFFNKLNIIQSDPISDMDGQVWHNCIIKTYWIKIIQRNWKRIFKERKQIIKKRMNLDSLHYRQINGRWPIGLNYLPSISDINI